MSANVGLGENSIAGKFYTCPFGKNKNGYRSLYKAVTKIPFSDEPCGKESVSAERQKSYEKISCPNPLCIKVFNIMDCFDKHSDTGTCKLKETNPPTLAKEIIQPVTISLLVM